MKEFIWFKNSKHRNSVHKRNKNIKKEKLDQLLKDGWVQIIGEEGGVMNMKSLEKPKPKAKPKPKTKAKKKK